MYQIDTAGSDIFPPLSPLIFDKEETAVLGFFEEMNMLENNSLWRINCADPVYIHRHSFGKMT
jgi:hypothetical protein